MRGRERERDSPDSRSALVESAQGSHKNLRQVHTGWNSHQANAKRTLVKSGSLT